MFTKRVLPNGLRVVLAPMPQVKSVTVLVMVATGSRYESERTSGISHFLEHLLFKGTKKRPSSLAISALLDGVGASFNAFTSKEYTGFYVKCSSEHLGLALDVLSDIILNSLLDPAEIEKERGVVIEEMNMREDEPQVKVWELYEGLLYPRSPLGRPVIGEKEVIQKTGRAEIASYIAKSYHGRAMVLGLAGKWDGAIEKKMEKFFGKIASGKENRFLPVDDRQGEPKVAVKYKKTEQGHLVLGLRTFPMDHPDKYALGLLTTILGGSMSSRLWLEVREKRGLAYYVSSDADYFADCGYLATAAGFKLTAVEEGTKVILEQLELLRTKGVTEEELQRAKDFAHGHLALSLENSYNVASFYTSRELLLKKIETPEELEAKVRAVTAADVKRVANEVIKEKTLNMALIGPFKDEGKFAKLLKI